MNTYRQHINLPRQARSNLKSSVAAVGGMLAASEAIQAAEARRFPGKIIIYPQLEDLPLLGIRELAEKHPEIKSKVGDQNLWTREAEAELFELSGK